MFRLGIWTLGSHFCTCLFQAQTPNGKCYIWTFATFNNSNNNNNNNNNSICIAPCLSVFPVSSLIRVEDGNFFDSELMKSHISHITSACFYQLWRLCAVRSQLGQEVIGHLVSAFILSRLDYCNAVLAGLPASTLAPLQRVMHAATRVICDLKPYNHVTPTLKALHWLPVKQRIEFKLCLLVHLVINKRPPVHLQNLLTTTASLPGRASNNDLVKQSTRLKLGERAFSVAGLCIWS